MKFAKICVAYGEQDAHGHIEQQKNLLEFFAVARPIASKVPKKNLKNNFFIRVCSVGSS